MKAFQRNGTRFNRTSIPEAEKIGMAFEKEGENELGQFHLYAINRVGVKKDER